MNEQESPVENLEGEETEGVQAPESGNASKPLEQTPVEEKPLDREPELTPEEVEAREAKDEARAEELAGELSGRSSDIAQEKPNELSQEDLDRLTGYFTMKRDFIAKSIEKAKKSEEQREQRRLTQEEELPRNIFLRVAKRTINAISAQASDPEYVARYIAKWEDDLRETSGAIEEITQGKVDMAENILVRGIEHNIKGLRGIRIVPEKGFDEIRRMDYNMMRNSVQALRIINPQKADEYQQELDKGY